MILSPSHSHIFSTLFSDPEMAHRFSDTQVIAYLLQVEAALARAQARLGVIPKEAAEQIVSCITQFQVDCTALQVSTDKAGVPVMGLVKQLRQQVGGNAASYVHWGATTQDIMDTALVLQMKSAFEQLESTMEKLMCELGGLADKHRDTLMAGRTHSQQALPITFGLKIAGWLSPFLRHRQRLQQIKERVLAVQFGGAVGTLAPFGTSGIKIQEELAKELGLSPSLMTWHTQRDNLVEVASWLSLVSGSLAKMGQDIILLAQTEVGELRESADRSRGGSSTMPQKSNPVISELLIAAARSNASSLSAMHHALIHEHERATHGWQVEWLTFPSMFVLTQAALNKALFLSQNLVVDEVRMRQNVAASNGLMLGETISFALADHMGRAEAKKFIKEACWLAIETRQHVIDILKEKTDLPLDWERLRDESNYLGSSTLFIDRVLEQI